MTAHRVLVVAGPTASGKTALAVELAHRWKAVVLSADAMQVYCGMDIGTAKATESERAGIEHFGLDLRQPNEGFDASDFIALYEHVRDQHPRIIVAGGTHLYIRSLIRGLVKTPAVDADIRAELEADPRLYERLAEVDPVLAARLHPNDRVRLVRGMEVFIQTGQKLSALQAEHARAENQVEAEVLWCDRADWAERIDARVESMMTAGYLDEVQALLDAGFTRELKPMQSLGYRHLADHLAGEVPLDEAVRRTQRDTRRFARKQRTWRKNLGAPTLDAGDGGVCEAAAERSFR